MPRLPLLLAVSCLGTVAALVGGRHWLTTLPAPTPATADPGLERIRRWSPDPWRRREASLLLAARKGASDDLTRQRTLLRAQGWGVDPLAAVVLKRDALAAGRLDRQDLAELHWRDLLGRFPADPAAADALYVLGRQRPELRAQLLQRFPGHPAALAAASELGPDNAQLRTGALHLARWGARWPGAHERLRQRCGAHAAGLSTDERAVLSQGLAELGDGRAALGCLGEAAPEALSPEGQLILGRTLLAGEGPERARGQALLLNLAGRKPDSPQAEAAVRELADQDGADSTALLARLPPRWRDSAPVRAQRLRSGGGAPGGAGGTPRLEQALAVLRRWPGDPASWDLQWELAREQLLKGRWGQAQTLLSGIDSRELSPPLAARQRFWLGYSLQKLGRRDQAVATWRQLRRHQPGGYYGWRSALQLGETRSSLLEPGRPPESPGVTWEPLASGDADLDRLWRLDQGTEAWEVWRTRSGGRPPEGNQERLLEGRLRQGVGDDWTGLGLLELAQLRLRRDECELMPQLERSLHPRRFLDVFSPAAQSEDVREELLLAVAKQESRFSPGVRSVAGAVGLLQLLPTTASELAGRSIKPSELEDPALNARLGARYLRQLLEHWKGDPFLAVASYNAGPGAVEGWIGPLRQQAPELWVEAIPYPETRLYVKKVLGNLWSYGQGGEPSSSCPP